MLRGLRVSGAKQGVQTLSRWAHRHRPQRVARLQVLANAGFGAPGSAQVQAVRADHQG